MRLRTVEDLKVATTILHDARKTFSCEQPRTDKDGQTSWHNPVTNTDVFYGPHGSAFLGIDLDTLQVYCCVCRGEREHHDTPKNPIARGKTGRIHFVSA